MSGTFNCPTCGAPLEYSGSGEIVRCPYCANSVIVPETLRPKTQQPPGPIADPNRVSITAAELEQIKLLLAGGQKIEAIKVYRQATSLGLKEAKDAVDAMEAANPELKSGTAAASSKRYTAGVILFGMSFFAIALIFPIAFFPMSVESWQAQQYAAAFFSALGAVIWALVWGGIGWLILFAKV